MSPRSAIIVFAKPPVPGRVKTRLLGKLTPAQAAAVHRACLEDTLRQVARIAGCHRVLLLASSSRPARRFAETIGLGRRWQVGAQRGPDLGARLQRAFKSFLRAGYRKVVVVGSDTPWMGRRRIRQAIRLLDTVDVVLGPTADGGYYLVGARRLFPTMFRGIPWGTAHVFGKTLAALNRAQASYRLLLRDFDLDRPADLARAAQLLRRKPERAPALAQWLREWRAAWVSRSSRRR